MSTASPEVNVSSNGKPPRPSALPVCVEGIPAELRDKRHWVLWRYEFRDGRWTKRPYHVSGRPASSTDPSTWSTFADVLTAYRAGGWDGIGLIHLPEDSLTGVDLDKCRDPDTGTLTPEATAIVRRLDTYTEASPSATGVRAYCHAKKPGRQSRKGWVELYDGLTAEGEPGGRYLTVTGQRLTDYPSSINDRQAAVEALYRETFASKQQAAASAGQLPLDAGELARWRCLGPDKQARILALWAGNISDYDHDDSRADLALSFFLLVLTNGDRHRAEQLFGQSALGQREKWTGREDYRRRTFDQAAEGFTPWREDPAAKQDGGLKGKRAKPSTAAAIIMAYWQEKYDFIFRRKGQVFYSSKLGEMKGSDLLRGAPSDLIARLKGDREKRFALFKREAPTALLDLWGQLRDETRSEEIPEQARESFRGAVSKALLTVVALQYRRGDPEDVQRRPLIDWANTFAKEASWEDVRGLRLWSRKVNKQLRIRLRVEVFAQIHFTELARLTPSEFTDLAALYGVGQRCKVEGGSTRAVELDPEFLAEVLALPPPDNGAAGHLGHLGQDGQPHACACEASVPSCASYASGQGGGCGSGVPTYTSSKEGRADSSSSCGPDFEDGQGDAWDKDQ